MKLIKDYPPETQWQTRDGRPVRVLCADRLGYGDASVVGLVRHPGNVEDLYSWRADGTTLGGNPDFFLVPVPVKREGWVNVYLHATGENVGAVHPTRERARQFAAACGMRAAACIPIEWTDGEGLS